MIDGRGQEARSADTDVHAKLHPSPEAHARTLIGRFEERFLTTNAAKVILGVLLAVLLIVPTVQSIIKIQETDPSAVRESQERRRTAVGRWLSTAELVCDGAAEVNPYGFGHWFPLPPAMLMAITPLTTLPPAVVAAIWAALKVAGLLGSAAFLIQGIRTHKFAVPVGVILLAGIFGARSIVSDLQHGNVNIFVLVWCTLVLGCYIRGRDVWAGVFVSLAIVTKITPALLLVYFLYKRAWALSLTALAGTAVLFLVVPGVYFGFAENVQLLADWFNMLIVPFAVHGFAASDIANQSLYGVLVRLADYNGWLPVEHMPVLETAVAGMDDMARPVGAWRYFVRAVSVLPILAILAWRCRTPKSLYRDPRVLLEFALVLLAMLLLSERTWKHHATTLLIVYIGIWYVVACLSWSDRYRAWHVVGLLVQLALLVGTTPGLLGDWAADALLGGGAFCWGLLLCFVQTAVLLESCHQRAGTAAT